MRWLDSAAPEVRSAVTSGAYGRAPNSDHGHLIPTPPTIDTIAAALDVASDILTRLTAFTVHPALVVEEDFVATPRATKLYPSFSPVRSVLSVNRLESGVATAIEATGWTAFGGAIYFSPDCFAMYGDWSWNVCGCRPAPREFLRISYQAGSTITASARQAVIALAHDIWLDGNGCEECGLPERTVNVTREGLSINVGDPSDPTLGAFTGIPSVDVWIKSVNPKRASRPSGVWSPDSPPPVVRSVQTARPEWGSTVHLSSDVHVNVSTANA